MYRDKLAEALGISKEDKEILDAGSDHSYNCRCETCRQWWKLMGPDGEVNEKPFYGPFTKEEVEQ